MKNKKGNLNLIVPAILTLTLGAIILIFGLVMLDEIWQETIDDVGTITNESHAMTTVDVGVNVNSTYTTCGFRGMALTIATYAANATRVELANYTITSNGTITPVTGFVSPAQKINFTGTYLYGAGEDCRAGNATIEGQADFAEYYDLIVLAIIITIVISLLLVAFSMRRVK